MLNNASSLGAVKPIHWLAFSANWQSACFHLFGSSLAYSGASKWGSLPNTGTEHQENCQLSK